MSSNDLQLRQKYIQKQKPLNVHLHPKKTKKNSLRNTRVIVCLTTNDRKEIRKKGFKRERKKLETQNLYASG